MKGLVEGHPQVFSVGTPLSSVVKQPIVPCRLSGVDVHALIDTGSMKPFISSSVFNSISPRPVLSTDTQNCISITGQPLQVSGTTPLELSFPCSGSVAYSGNFLVSSTLFAPLQCVLGWDFLTSNGLQLSFDGDGAYFLVGVHGSTP